MTTIRRAAVPLTVDDVLEAARRRLTRLTPQQAWDAHRSGALLVDIRPHAQRTAEGEVPGALVLERNVLEWRLDPSSDARIDETAPGRAVVILCSGGYASSLAAAALLDFGLAATDVVGGAQRWKADGLPLVAGGTPAGGRSPQANDPTPPRRRRP